MRDACASKRGFVCGREAISIGSSQQGRGRGRSGICHMGRRERQKEKWKGGRRKGRNSAAHVNSLNAPCWPRGCWQHSFVDSFPLSNLFAHLLQSVSIPVALVMLDPSHRPVAWPCESRVSPIMLSGLLLNAAVSCRRVLPLLHREHSHKQTRLYTSS